MYEDNPGIPRNGHAMVCAEKREKVTQRSQGSLLPKNQEETSTGGITMEDKKKEDQEEYFCELFNFCCVLRGEVKYLEEIKEHIITEYVRKGKVKLIKPTYDKRELYIMTDEQWKEYQKLKDKDQRLIESMRWELIQNFWSRWERHEVYGKSTNRGD